MRFYLVGHEEEKAGCLEQMEIVWVSILGIGLWEPFDQKKMRKVLTKKFRLVHRVPFFEGSTDWNA